MDNVNEKRTKDEFGYNVSDLKLNSAKPIYRICEVCGREEIKKAQAVLKFNQTKCLHCSNKINANKNLDIRSQKVKKHWKENEHPRLGVPHTEECKKKMSTYRKENPVTISDEERERKSKANKGEKNFFYGKKHSEKSLIKMRLAAKKNAKRGADCNLYGKSYYAKCVDYYKKDGSIVRLKSSWEVKTAEFLDRNDISWEYEEKYFPVTYEYEGETKNGTYTPDFFLSNGEIWEVKGYWRKDALVKFEAFKKTYPDIKIILCNKEKLKDLSIL